MSKVKIVDARSPNGRQSMWSVWKVALSVVPSPETLFRSTPPPVNSVFSLRNGNPRPNLLMLCGRVVKNGSNTRVRLSASIPHPLSRTVKTNRWSAGSWSMSSHIWVAPAVTLLEAMSRTWSAIVLIAALLLFHSHAEGQRVLHEQSTPRFRGHTWEG